MRIISKFHDYYDTAQAYGQDMSVVYQRKTIEYDDVEKSPTIIQELLAKVIEAKAIEERWSWFYGHDNYLPNTIWGKRDSYRPHSGTIIFCGQLYSYVSLTQDIKGQLLAGQTAFFYDAESVLEFCDSNKLNIDTKGVNRKSTVRENILKRFAIKNEISKDWLIENKIICAKIGKEKVIINPLLKEFQFFKVFDPYQAYQELDSWICGTLSYPQNAMVELDDKSMIAKKGFDKWSFRKQPEGYGK